MASPSESNYQCTDCWENLGSPVFQCFNGHLLCPECNTNLSNCRICWEELPGKHIRNREIEKVILERSVVTCQCKQNGCELETQHGPLDCFHAVLNFCNYLGFDCRKFVSREMLLLHLKDSHDVECEMTEVEDLEIHQSEITMEQLINGAAEWKPVYFMSDNNIFFLRTTVTSAIVSWNISILGSKQAACKYGAKIKLVSLFENSENKYVEWAGPVKELKPKRKRDDDHNEIFSISIQQLQSFWSKDHDLDGSKGGWKLRMHIYKRRNQVHANANQALVVIKNIASSGKGSVKISMRENKPEREPGNSSIPELHPSTSTLMSAQDYNACMLYVIYKMVARAFGLDPDRHDRALQQLPMVQHLNIRCVSCRVKPIVGNRYKCIQCHNYDLCSTCARKSKGSMHSHMFIMITSPTLREAMLSFYRSLSQAYNSGPPVIAKTLKRTFRNRLCDGPCNRSPIVGITHNCAYCHDYDLCEKCVDRREVHEHGIFLANCNRK